MCIRDRPNLPQPRITSLRRTIVALTIFSLIVTVSGAFLCVALIPPHEWPAWSAAPLSGLIHHLALPPAFLGMLAVILAIAAAVILGQTVGVALIDMRGVLQRAACRGRSIRATPRGNGSTRARPPWPSRSSSLADASPGSRMPTPPARSCAC